MRVTVLTPSRNKILLDAVETLRDVKRQIMAKTGIPARQQLVYFRGRQLKSLRRPLTAYHVRDDSTLYLVKRLGICRCLACRNSRYIEREEVEEERQQLRRLLGYVPPGPEDEGLSQVVIPAEVTTEVEDEVSDTTGIGGTATWIPGRDSVYQWRRREVEDLQNEEDNAMVEDETDVEGNGEEGEVGLEENVEEVPMEAANEDVAEEGDDEGDNDEAEANEVESDEVEEGADEGAEDGIEETEGSNQDVVEYEEEAMEEVAGESEELNEEGEESDAAEEDLELSGEDADDEEEPEEVAEEEETEILEIEDIEDEPFNDHDEDAAEDAADDAGEEEDEDATILYSLVTGREDNPRGEELELTSGRTREEDEEEEEDRENRRTERVFVRQPAFEEDGANSVGEEDPDIAELEDEEEPTPAAGGQSSEDGGVPGRVEDLLLAMTRPTPDPEGEEEQPEEQYPEDDPLFDPPDEEDPLLEPGEEDAGYMSGDEMDRA